MLVIIVLPKHIYIIVGTMHRQLQTCSSVADVCSVTLVWMAFSAVESSYFCPIVNIATYTSVNVIFVYVPTIYSPRKAVIKFRFL